MREAERLVEMLLNEVEAYVLVPRYDATSGDLFDVYTAQSQKELARIRDWLSQQKSNGLVYLPGEGATGDPKRSRRQFRLIGPDLEQFVARIREIDPEEIWGLIRKYQALEKPLPDEKKTPPAGGADDPFADDPAAARLGATFTDADYTHKGYRYGVAVQAVDAGGPLYRAGMRPGDIVLKLGTNYVTDVNDMTKRVGTLQKGTPVRLVVKRGQKDYHFNVTPA